MKNNRVRSIFKKIFSYLSQSILLIIVALTVLVTVATFLYWQTNVVADGVKKFINYSLNDSTKINYATIKGSLFNNIRIDSLSFELDGKLKITAKQITLKYDLWPLFDGQIKISSANIDSLQISIIPQSSLEEKEKKKFNLDSLFHSFQNSHVIDSLLAKMPPLEVDDFELKTGHLEVVGKGLTFENIYVNARIKTAPDELNFELNNFSAYWYEKDLELESLQFQLIAKGGQVTLNKFLMEAGNSRVILSGDLEIENMLAIFSMEEFHIDFRDFSGFVPAFSNGGIADGSLSFIGSPQDFAIKAELSGNWQGHILNRLKMAFSYEFGNIIIDTLSVESNSGYLSLNSEINPLKSATGSLVFNRIKLNTLNPDFPESEINGSVNFDFPTGAFDINKLGQTIKKLTGKGELIIYNSHYQQFWLDSLRFALSADKGSIEIEQPSFLKIANQARFDIFGELDRENQLNFQIHTARGDLNNLTTALGMDSLYGSYYSDFRAYGNLENPQIQGEFWIKGFRYKKVFLDSIALDMQLSNILTTPTGSGNFSITKGTVYNIPIRNVTLNAAKDSSKIRISNARIFSDDNYFETTLDIVPRENGLDIIIDRLRMEYEKYWLENSRNIILNIDSAKVVFDDFNLTGPGNTLFIANGGYDILNKDINFSLDLQSLNLEPFQQFIGDKHLVEGIVSGKAELKHILTEPDVLINMAGQNIIYNHVTFGNFKADLHYVKEKMFIKDLFIESDSSKLSIEGDLAFQFDKKVGQFLDLIRDTKTNLKVKWANIDLQKYNSILKLKRPLKGMLDGYLEIEGTVDDPFMRQSLTVSGFKYGKFDIDSLVMFGQYSAGYMILDSLSADFNGTSFSLKGYQQFDLGLGSDDTVFTDNPFEFYLVSKDDKLEFIGLFNDQIEAIYGDFEIETYISGTPQKPSISSGTIKLDNGRILLSRVKDPIENVNIDMEIEENILTINSFSGKSEQERDLLQTAYSYLRKLWSWLLPDEKEKGTFTVDGAINLENILRPDIDISIKMNEFFVDYFVESTKLSVSTDNLKITGQDTISLTGKMTLPAGEFEVNLEQMQKNIYLQQPVTSPKKPYVVINLEIEIPGNFVITSSALDLQNNFKIVMRGNLQVSRAAGSNKMSLIGLLETESGKFTSFNQSFSIASGSIDFNNPVRINPDLNITAQKRLKGKIFELIISGNLETIRQNIIVRDEHTKEELNLSPQDKIALLTLGADISMVSSKTDSTIRGVGEDVASNVMLMAAERGVEELTGLDKVEISSSAKLLDLQKLKLNNGLKQASISFGKYLTSDLYIEYRTQFGSGVPTPKLSWDAGNRITLQYRINKRWSFESHYEKTLLLGNNKIQLGLAWEYSF